MSSKWNVNYKTRLICKPSQLKTRKRNACTGESIETEEAYVCCKCGLVLEDIFQPDIHWCDHALMPRIYGGADRLNAMHKVLIKFLDKISFCTYLPMYTLEERLRDMKIDSGFKSLNYAICVMCILEGDEQAEEQVRPHLPRSDVAWARSLHLLSPVPEIFVRNWLRNLLKPTGRDLSDRQKKVSLCYKCFDDVERRMMQDLISSYRAGLDWNTSDLEKVPIPLRHALYHYSVAVCKNKWKKNVYFLSSLSTIFFFSIFYFFKKSSNVIVCHEFCMNAFDHVFGKVLGKMQLTVKLEGGVLGKMSSSKTILRFLSPLVRWNGLLSVCEKTNTEFRWMAKTPSEFLDKLSTYFWPAICWICDTDFPKAKVSFGAAVELSKTTWLGENGGATCLPSTDVMLAMWKYRASPPNPVNA